MTYWNGIEVKESVYAGEYKEIVSSFLHLLKNFQTFESFKADNDIFIPLLSKAPEVGEPFVFCPSNSKLCLFLCTEQFGNDYWSSVQTLPLLVALNFDAAEEIPLDAAIRRSYWTTSRFYTFNIPANKVCI